MFRKGEPMKKLVAFAMILAIGLFTAAGCEKKADKSKAKEGDKAKVAAPADKAPDTTPAPKADDKAK
jgi:hypothetical protein